MSSLTAVNHTFFFRVVGFFPVAIDNQNRTALNYVGNWMQNIASGVPSPFMQTTVAQSSVSMNFTGGLAVAVYGSRNYGHGEYDVVRTTGMSLYWLGILEFE